MELRSRQRTRVASVHLRRYLIVVLVAWCLMSPVACGSGDDDAAARGSDVAEGPAEEDILNEPPYGPGVEVGRSYDYVLYTHCGIEWTRIDDVWWRAARRDDGNLNPPPGWGNPYDAGELVVIGDDEAVYRGGPGVEVEFERTGYVDAPFPCE